MEGFTVIENIFDAPEWNYIAKPAMELADSFCVVFPNGEDDEENPLLTGRRDFIGLSNLTAAPWPQMKNATVYSGSLTHTVKELFQTYLEEDEKTTGSLWNFSLFKGEEELLNVQDFNVGLINHGTVLTAHLKEKGMEMD